MPKGIVRCRKISRELHTFGSQDYKEAGKRHFSARSCAIKWPLLAMLLVLSVLLPGYALDMKADSTRVVTLMGPSTPPCAKGLGPLQVHPDNRRYFMDPCGHVVYLTGVHERNNFTVSLMESNLSQFDYEAYLELLGHNDLNFIRLWTWEDARRASVPYVRTGPGKANDGKPKFDVTRFNQSHFDQLRSRVIAARNREIYVGVMLFQGWSVENDTKKPGYVAWDFHPLHRNNNINGLDGDTNGDGEGTEVHTLQDARITALQKTYIRKVLATVDDLENVIYEISNETNGNNGQGDQWQYEMIRYVHGRSNKLVWMSGQWPGQNNAALFDSPAAVVSPINGGGLGDWKNNPPASDGNKIIIQDSDHLGAQTTTPQHIWKWFMRGMHAIILDGSLNGLGFPPHPVAVRNALRHIQAYSERIDLVAMTPQNSLSSSHYVLANRGVEYLIYQPAAGSFWVDVAKGLYDLEWFNPDSGKVARSGNVTAIGVRRTFKPPFRGQAVLYLKAHTAPPESVYGDGRCNGTGTPSNC